MSVMPLNQENFSQQVSGTTPVLVDFWASWCGPCHMLSPVVEELSQEHPEITFAKVNVDEAPELAQQFHVSAIPTLVLFRDGEPVDVSVGVRTKEELESFLDRFSRFQGLFPWARCPSPSILTAQGLSLPVYQHRHAGAQVGAHRQQVLHPCFPVRNH